MQFSINPPKGFLGWTVYLIIGKFIIDIGKYIYKHRGSSSETKKDMIEIRKALAKSITKEDIRIIIREENKNFITKDLLDSKLEAFEERIEGKIALNFKDIEMIHKESLLREEKAIKLWENSRTEHHKSKHRIDEVYGKLVERLNGKRK